MLLVLLILGVFDPAKSLPPTLLAEVVVENRTRARPNMENLLVASMMVSTLSRLLQLNEGRNLLALVADPLLHLLPVGKEPESLEGRLVEGVEGVVCSDPDPNALVVVYLPGVQDHHPSVRDDTQALVPCNFEFFEPRVVPRLPLHQVPSEHVVEPLQNLFLCQFWLRLDHLLGDLLVRVTILFVD